jgi:O-antigen/teichoic acid export membrane protein
MVAGRRASARVRGPRSLFVASALAALLSLAYQAVISRTLGPARYGSFAALAALVTVVSVPLAAAQTTAVQAAAVDWSAPSADMVARGLRVGAVLLAAGAFAGLPLDVVLGVGDPLACTLVGAYAGLALAGAIARGVLLGRERWMIVGASMVVSSAARVVFATAMTPAAGLVGAIAATVLAESISTVAVVLAAARLASDPAAAPLRGRRGDMGHALGTQLGVWVMASLGVLLGRHVLDGQTGGRLAASATATTFALFVPMALAASLLPRFAAGIGGTTLRQSLLAATALGAAIVATFALIGSDVVAAAAGPEFRPDRWMIVGLASTVASLGVVAVSTQFLLTRRHPASLAPWLSVSVVVVSSFVLRPDAAVLVGLLALTSAAVALLTVRAALRVDRATSTATSSSLSPGTIGLSIVLPTHNDGARLRPAVDSTLAVLDRVADRSGLDGEVVVVIDGSTDDSTNTLVDCPANVRVIELASNQGKGAALAAGYRASRGHLVGYVDGDGDIDPEVIERLVAAMDASVWCAIASKYEAAAVVHATRTRRSLSVIARFVVRQLFRLEVRDTQCGAKLFRRDALATLLPHARDHRFAFDLEVLAIGCRFGLGAIAEVPVRLTRAASSHSHVDVRVVARTALDIVRLWTRLAHVPLFVSGARASRDRRAHTNAPVPTFAPQALALDLLAVAA